MNCPLCDTKKCSACKRIDLSEMRLSWLQTLKFDPFPKDLNFKSLDKRRCSLCNLEYFVPALYGDSAFYEKISKYPWYYEENKWEFDIALDVISRLGQNNLLEIGCGNGFFLEKSSFLDIEAEGVDINRDAVSLCKAKGLQVEHIDIFDIKKSYDTVVLFQVLEHMQDVKEVFEFFSAKLVRPGGHLIIAVPNPEGYLKEVSLNLLDMPPHHNSSWSFSTFEHLDVQFGLKVVEYYKEPIRYVHYIGLLNSIISDQVKLMPGTLKVKIFHKLQSMIIAMIAPLTFLRDRDKIDGQTHLVVLKNVG
jgi:2-polyprenyl-3-methyl-5-hydroxy-6-metoxy-1,4-benzoquinol methylase